MSRETSRIIIVGGGGTIGCSTALHLVRQGYTPGNITILDVYTIPSAQSAGNDLNKIMGIALRTPVDLRLSIEARDMWRHDELFKIYFHNTGRLDCASSEKGIKQLREKYQKSIGSGYGLANSTEWLEDEDEILAKMPLLDRNNIKGWKGIWNGDGGWLAAGKSINAVGMYLRDKGVKIISGKAGSFSRPLFANDGMTCIGCKTEDGSEYFADKLVLAAGAWSPALIDLKDQCCSKAWVYAHMQLSPVEAAEYKDVPVVYHEDYGFFFEPDENGIIKVCDEFPGFTRFKSHQPYPSTIPLNISVPRSHAKHPTDTIPTSSDESINRAIQTFLPRFIDKPLLNKRMCWCTDTADAALLICEYPGWRNFIVATGDSGHTFKLFPSIGKHVVALIEDRLDDDLAHAWKWRPGGDAMKSRRAAPAMDLGDMPGWRHYYDDYADASP